MSAPRFLRRDSRLFPRSRADVRRDGSIAVSPSRVPVIDWCEAGARPRRTQPHGVLVVLSVPRPVPPRALGVDGFAQHLQAADGLAQHVPLRLPLLALEVE